MKITEVDVRLVRRSLTVAEGADTWSLMLRDPRSLRRGHTELVVVQLHTDEGLTGSTMVYGGQSGRPAATYLGEVIRPYLVGRDPGLIEEIAQDMYVLDRFHAFLPGNVAGPLNVALWDLMGRRAGLPLWKLLGGARPRVPCYRSSEFLPSVDAYVEDARRTKEQRFAGYKVHPPRQRDSEIEVCSAVRDAVGPDFTLMSDPVAAYQLADAIAVGRELERLAFKWFEEPLRDGNLHGYRELCRALDIPVAATEFLPGGLPAIATCLSFGAADIVRADVAWKGGFTEFRKIAALAEAFGTNCEVHTAMVSLLQVANLHAACSIANCDYFEVGGITEDTWGLGWQLELDQDGCVTAPVMPGLGVPLDWDVLDQATIATF